MKLRGKLRAPILVAQVQAWEVRFQVFGEMRLKTDDAGSRKRLIMKHKSHIASLEIKGSVESLY